MTDSSTPTFFAAFTIAAAAHVGVFAAFAWFDGADRSAQTPPVAQGEPIRVHVDPSDAIADMFTAPPHAPRALNTTPDAAAPHFTPPSASGASKISLVNTHPAASPQRDANMAQPPATAHDSSAPDITTPDASTASTTDQPATIATPPLPERPPAPPVQPPPTGITRGVQVDNLLQPIYPARSVRLGHEGDVVLAVHIRPAGTVASIDIQTSSGHPRLDNAAITAARKARFEPALDNGRPIEAIIVLPFEFRINERR